MKPDCFNGRRIRLRLQVFLSAVIRGYPWSSAFLLFLLVSSAHAQPAILRDRVKATWLPDQHTFWYQVKTGPDSHEFVLIDARTGARKNAPDLASLALPAPSPVHSSETTIEIRSTQRTGASSGIHLVNELDRELDLFWIDTGGKRVA